MTKKIIIVLIIVIIVILNINYIMASDKLTNITKEKIIEYGENIEYENNITENGIEYELVDITTQNNKVIESKEKEVIEEKLITYYEDIELKYNIYEENKDIEEDGYIGTLIRIDDSFEIIDKNSYIEQYKVYWNENYKNVDSKELNDIPKVVNINNINYYLVNSIWEVIETETIEGGDIPIKYNGIMNYEGIETKEIITSYIVQITYKGVLEKEKIDSTTIQCIYQPIKQEENNNIIPVVTAGSCIVFFSGIILFKKKNIKIYSLKNGEYKLVKNIKFNKKENLINLSFKTLDKKYKIELSNSLYKKLEFTTINIKNFDVLYNYEIVDKEFEIII